MSTRSLRGKVWKDASIGATSMSSFQAYHLYWPDLDNDLAVESIEHPERFPPCLKVSFRSASNAD